MYREVRFRDSKKTKALLLRQKKRHTLKSQIVVAREKQKITCTSFCNVEKHDFRVFKKSKVRIHHEIKPIEDSGYHGIQKLHANSEIPKKKSKKKPLTKEDKKRNKKLSQIRVFVKNVIALIKRIQNSRR